MLSKSVSACTAYTYLPEVKSFKATGDITTANLTWTKQSGAKGYVIYMFDEAKKSYARLVETESNVNAYTVKGLAEGASHKFAIRAYKSVSDKQVLSRTYPVATTVTKLSEVKNFKASSDVNSITLSWNKNNNAQGYVVYDYNFAKKKYTRLEQTNDTTITINGLEKASNHQYAIRACTIVDGKEVLSKTFPTISTHTYLPTVTGFKANADLTCIKLSWSKTDGAKGYIVYYYDKEKKNYVRSVVIQNPDTTTWTYQGMKPQTDYRYAVRAFTKVGTNEILSKSSVVVNVGTYVPDVQNFTGKTKGTGAELSWKKMNSPQGYVIYQYNKSAKKYERLAKTANVTSYVIKKAVLDKSDIFAIRAYKTLNGKEYLSKNPVSVSVQRVNTLAIEYPDEECEAEDDIVSDTQNDDKQETTPYLDE